MPTLKTLVVWNPHAGRVGEAASVRAILDAMTDYDVEETSSPDHAEHLAQHASSQGYRAVIAAGGDGTVNSVATGLYTSRKQLCQATADSSKTMSVNDQAASDSLPSKSQLPPTLGVLPMGTANDMAATLAMPWSLEESLAVLKQERQRTIDLISVSSPQRNWTFVNVGAGGNSDRVTELLTDEIKSTWGPWAYLRGAFSVLADLASFDATVRFDDERPFDISLWNVIIGNGRTNAGRLHVTPRANPEDGLMDVVLVRDGTGFDVATLGTQFFLGDYLESEMVTYRQARRFVISSEPNISFTVDGEAVSGDPLEFEVCPQALPVFVGPDYVCEPPLN